MQKEEMFSMRKKRFTAFLLSLAMAGTSLYTCGVIDVQAAAVAEEGTENPNLEQLTEIQEQAAAVEEVAEPEVQAEAAEEVAEPEVQATDISSPIRLTNVTGSAETGYEVEWNKTVTVTDDFSGHTYDYTITDKTGGTVDSGELTSSSAGVSVNNDWRGGTLSIVKRTTATGESSTIDIKIVAVDASTVPGLVKFQKLTGTTPAVSYNSQPQTPEVVVSDNYGTVSGSQSTVLYSIRYYNNDDVNDNAYAVLSFDNPNERYKGTVRMPFRIVRNNIGGVSVNVTGSFRYNGKAQQPATFTVTDSMNSATVLAGDDYSITWNNNTNSGNAKATVRLTGYHSRFPVASYDVDAFVISQNNTAKFTPSFVNGKSSYPVGVSLCEIISDNVKVEAIDNGESLPVSVGDYEIVSLNKKPMSSVSADTKFDKIGDYTLHFVGSGSGNYAPTVSGDLTFTVGGVKLTPDAIKVSVNQAFTYDGTPKILRPQDVTVSVNGLDENKKQVNISSGDMNGLYEIVDYAKNINAGTAEATLRLTSGNYIGSTKTISYNISQADLSNVVTKCTPKETKFTYDGEKHIPEVDFTKKADASTCVISDGDYTVLVSSNLYSGDGGEAGTTSGNYLCKVSANTTGNYKGEIEGIECEILRKSISANDITGFDVQGKTYNYTGQKIIPTFSLVYPSNSKNSTLVKGKDYTVVNGKTGDSVDIGENNGSIIVTGIGNYCGTLTATFSIGGAGFTKAMVSANNKITYRGTALSVGDLNISVSSDYHAVPSNYYTVSLGDREVKDAGSYTLTIIGKGFYENAAPISVDYTIVPKPFTTDTVSLNGVVAYKYKGGIAEPQAFISDNYLRTISGCDPYLVEGRDFRIEKTTNTQTPTCRIIGMGNYTTKILGTYEITTTPSDLKDVATVSAGGTAYTYTAKSQLIDAKDLKVWDKVHNVDLVYREDFLTGDMPTALKAGTVWVDIRAMGTEYTGETKVSINIAPKNIADENVEQISENNYTESVNYIGSEVEYQVPATLKSGCLSFNGEILSTNDYSVRLRKGDVVSANYKDAGEYEIIAVAKGNYTGVRVLGTLTVNPIQLKDSDFSLARDRFDYAEGVTPSIVVVPQIPGLLVGQDYTVSYDEVNAGTRGSHEVKVTGKGNYAGEITLTYVVGPITLSEGNTKTYYAGTASDGNALVQVAVEGKALNPGTDYEVVSVSEIAGSSPKAWNVTIKGKGAYEGSVTQQVVEGKIMILDLNVAVSGDFTYNGQAQAPTAADVVVTVAGKTLSQNTDYTLVIPEGTVNAGSYDVVVTGTGDYEGEAKGAYEIKAISFAEENVTVGATVEYTGSNVTPPVTVTVDGKTLVAGVDYVVDTEADMQNVGEKTLTVIGIGNYANSTPVTKTFEVVPASMTGARVNVTAVTYTGAAQTAKVTSVIVNDRVLQAGTDYTVETKKATNAGTVKVKVTGKDNYTGTATGDFVIKARNLSKAAISGIKDRVYTSKALGQTSSLKVVVDKKTLKKNTDYTISYKNNKKIGEASFTIKGKGNYTGTTTARTFRIYPKKAAIDSLKAGSKRFTVQTKRQGGGIQYQVQYRLKGAKGYTRVESKKVKVVVKGLRKGKTYVVRVRTYKKVGGKTYYGEFSKARNVKIK